MLTLRRAGGGLNNIHPTPLEAAARMEGDLAEAQNARNVNKPAADRVCVGVCDNRLPYLQYALLSLVRGTGGLTLCQWST